MKKFVGFLALTLTGPLTLDAHATGGAQPRSGTYYRDVIKNFDNSLTYSDPALYVNGSLLRISAWSKAEGVCKALRPKIKIKDAAITMQKSYIQPMVVVYGSGKSAGTMNDDHFVKFITCK